MVAPRYHRDVAPHPIVTAPAVTPRPEVAVEIGPGRGDFLFHLARQHPALHVIGIEIRHQRFCKLLRHMQSHHNISLIWGDARAVLPQLAAHYRLRALYIHFPDPWPKRRHTKHRLMQRAFIDCCAHALASDGALIFTTDHAPYASWTAAQFAQCPHLTGGLVPDITTQDPAAYPTYFAQKWLREGRTIYYQKYRKIS